MSTSNYQNHPAFLAFRGSNVKKDTAPTQLDDSKRDKLELAQDEKVETKKD